jgi:O-antigen ligase
LAATYTFSRAGYLAILFSVFVLGILKDRKLLLVLGGFLLVWQSVVPTAVRERVNMTQNSNGQLEASAQERVDLWENAERSILSSPIVGNGFATFQLGEHVDNLKDTHNWYVKVLAETGLIGLILAMLLLQQLIALSYRLFKRASDPLYQGLGLGLLLTTCSCIVSNCFGDRWTYVEITGLLWVLAGAAIRATHLALPKATPEPAEFGTTATIDSHMAFR